MSESMDETSNYDHSNTKQYFPLLLFIVLCKVVLTLTIVNESSTFLWYHLTCFTRSGSNCQSLDKIQKCYHSNRTAKVFFFLKFSVEKCKFVNSI